MTPPEADAKDAPGKGGRSERAVQTALDGIVLESLRPIALALGLLYLLFTAAHLFLLPPGVREWMSGSALLTAALLLGGRHLLGKFDVPTSWAHPLGAVVAALVLVNSLLHLFLTGEPAQTTNLLLLILGMAILFLDQAWFAVVVVITLVGWIFAVLTAESAAEWNHFGFSLLMATALAYAVLVIRIRSYRRLEELRFQDHLRRVEVEAALERTEAARRGESEARAELEEAIRHLKESEERFRRLSEATFEGVIIHRDGEILDANRRAHDLFDYPLGTLPGRSVLDLVGDESRPRVAEALKHGPPAGDQEESIELEGARADGSRFPAVLTVNRASHLGRPALVTVIRDVTAQRRVEEVLRRAAREAEESNRAKSAFLANMSHELRTPLNAVIGFANILLKKSGQLENRHVEYLNRILSNGEHLLLLINDVLDLSKIEAGRMEVVRESVDLEPLLGEVVGSVEIQARRKGIGLDLILPPGLKPLLADQQRLKQVLINLVGNGVKFTDEGGVTVRVQAAADGRPLRIQVEDTGIGIPAERIPMIFEAFQQVDGSTTRRFSGTGLGLTISRSLCELMGFALRARSVPGEGSVFTVDLEPARV